MQQPSDFVVSAFSIYEPGSCEIEATAIADTALLWHTKYLCQDIGRGYLLNAKATRLDCGKWEIKYIFTPAAGYIKFFDVRPWWQRLWAWIKRNNRPETLDLTEA